MDAPPFDVEPAPYAERRFEAAISDMGFEVRVIIEVSAERLGADVNECAEQAAMTAARTFAAGQPRDGLEPFGRPVPF